MLLKLLKYEIKSSYGRFIMAFLVYSLIASVLLIFFRNHETLNSSLLTFGIIALSVITFLIIFQRYNTNLYHSEGYLMFTLPVDGKTLLLSKLISAFIWLAALALFIVPWVIILEFYYSGSGFINPTYKFTEINKTYAIMGGIEYCISIFESVLVIYFSISVSKLPIWRKFGVLAGFATFFGVEISNSFFSFLFTKIAKHTNPTVTFNSFPINNLLFQYFLDLFILALLFFATSYLLNNRTSLE